MKRDKKYFEELAKELDRLFPKYEKCQCGKRLQGRSKALVLNAYANYLHNKRMFEELTMLELDNLPESPDQEPIKRTPN